MESHLFLWSLNRMWWYSLQLWIVQIGIQIMLLDDCIHTLQTHCRNLSVARVELLELLFCDKSMKLSSQKWSCFQFDRSTLTYHSLSLPPSFRPPPPLSLSINVRNWYFYGHMQCRCTSGVGTKQFHFGRAIQNLVMDCNDVVVPTVPYIMCHFSM